MAGNFAPKIPARKRKVLAEHLLFLLWPVIHYDIGLEKLINGGILLSSGGGGGKNIEKLISGEGDVYLALKSTSAEEIILLQSTQPEPDNICCRYRT